jgi:hypothetical protein
VAVTIKIKQLYGEHENWLAKNVGPRLHYLHNSIGGEGWIAKKGTEEVEMEGHGVTYRGHVTVWNLTFQEDKYATWFRIMFPE